MSNYYHYKIVGTEVDTFVAAMKLKKNMPLNSLHTTKIKDVFKALMTIKDKKKNNKLFDIIIIMTKN